MPSGKGYAANRNYKQERKTAKARGETGVGSKSGDNVRHKARRKMEEKVGKEKLKGKDVGHKKPLKNGGSNNIKNLKVQDKKSNRSEGGKIGNRKGKAKKS